MASWVDPRMMAVVLLVAGACAPNRHAGEDRRVNDLRTENRLLEEELQRIEALVTELLEGVEHRQRAIDDYRLLVGKLDFKLGAYGNGPRLPTLVLPQGIVVSVKSSDVGTFVTISVGSKGHVRIGDEYHLSRGPHYVGRLDIIRVNKDSAVGRFDEKVAGPSAPPQTGDKAWVD